MGAYQLYNKYSSCLTSWYCKAEQPYHKSIHYQDKYMFYCINIAKILNSFCPAGQCSHFVCYHEKLLEAATIFNSCLWNTSIHKNIFTLVGQVGCGWSSHLPCSLPHWAPSVSYMGGLLQGGFLWAMLDTARHLNRVTNLYRGTFTETTD